MNELERVVREIEDKTGIVIGVSPTDEQTFSDGVTIDEKKQETCFRFSFGGGRYKGSVCGVDEVSHNYALLLSSLLENAHLQTPLNKNDWFKRILFGEADNTAVYRFVSKYALPDIPCHVLCFHSNSHIADMEDLVSQAETASQDCVVPIDENNFVLVKFEVNDSDYQSASDYANFIAGSIFEEIGVHPVIGVGGSVRRFSDVSVSYQQAATAVRMCKTFSSKGAVHTYKEYLLVKMIEEIPENKLSEFFSELLTDEAKELLDDGDMLNTAEEFLINSLNVSETSRNLYMHRNTLMYRLDKIERITGMNIRNFSDAVSFRLLTVLYKLLK